MFKKKKIWKTNIKKLINLWKWFKNLKKQKNILSISIWIFGIFFIILVWYWFTSQISKMKFDLDFILNMTWFDLTFEELSKNTNIKKSQDWKTNILIIGRWWQENEAPELTDSILLASINYEKQSVSIFSVPRDLYVEFPTSWAWKINEVYFRWIKKFQDEILWINTLKEVLTKITWEEIHYFINLDFKWFRQIIDTIWGIDINIPETIIDTTYPGPNWWYQTFSIKAWPQIIDWETALKYSRSRHSTSDFDRSLRQQLIIKSIRDKVLSIWLLSSPSKIKSLFSILKKNILTDIDISQIINLSLFLKDIPRENIVSSNLNDSCFYWSDVCEKWWFLYVPLRADFNWASVLLQNWATKWNPSNYDSLIKYTNLVFNHPLIYKENLKIWVFNATKEPWLATWVAQNLKKYWFNIPAYNSVWNIRNEIFEKSKIFYTTWSWWTKPETIKALELFIFWWSQEVDILPKISKDDDVKIQIIIWNDYKFLNF